MGEACSTHEGHDKCVQYLVRKIEGKRSRARTRHKCEDNFKKYFKEIVCEVMDWIKLAQDSVKW
jgi:hypothetical protein